MAKHFFFKELLTSQFMVGGTLVQFEPLDGNNGVIMVDSEAQPDLLRGLTTAANEQRNGVILINEERYEAEKKSHPFNPSNRRSRAEPLRVLQVDIPKHQAPDAAHAEKSNGATPSTPRGIAPVSNNPLGAAPPNPFTPVTPEQDLQRTQDAIAGRSTGESPTGQPVTTGTAEQGAANKPAFIPKTGKATPQQTEKPPGAEQPNK